MIILEFPPVPTPDGQPLCRCGARTRARACSVVVVNGGRRPVSPGAVAHDVIHLTRPRLSLRSTQVALGGDEAMLRRGH
jgi:hypothetical protein